ncbi:CocE/NonD family hydrolase (plasmid) [Mycolicibacterium psychrotolerans]|uniref:CocE/NonD family hydrolase n=1 Tax=Mycolicibacterium psychrotolerans TaxID=216929 RepID=UPI003D672C86
MPDRGFQRHYSDGIAPEKGKYPGHGYTCTVADGLLIERDVAVTMRDGVTIYVDLFRPADSADADLPTLIAWSAYGKHSPQQLGDFPADTGVRDGSLSRYVAFESPDPIYWCPAGYAVIFADPRGTWGSEGIAESFWGIEEARDYHDLIEWAGTQSWSNGKVGMAGVSYLAIIQWLTAATQPPHLAAMNPWEGVSDLYRDFAFHAGIPETQFHPWWHEGVLYSRTKVEDTVAMREAHPLDDEYWATKRADFAKITVPAYVVASWSDHGLHTRGTLEAFKGLRSDQKWLEIHGRKKWGYYYAEQSITRQRAFFDAFLKGECTDVERWPRVRYEVRERYYQGRNETCEQWPPATTEYRSLFLDAASGTLSTESVAEAASASYVSTDDDDRIAFDYRFSTDTEIVGNSKLRLWVEAESADDMDIFVALQKVDADGQLVQFPFFSIWDDGQVALGWLRASHRELDAQRSTPHQPWLAHLREQKLEPGQRVAVDIEILPSGTAFRAGETLRLVIQGTDVNKYPPGTPTQRHHSDRNEGRHIIHTGGPYDAHLLIPVTNGGKA